MKTKGWILLLVFSLAVNGAFLAACGYQVYRHGRGLPSASCPLSSGESYLYKALDLSDSQLQKMEPLARQFHAGLRELSRETDRKRERLVKLLRAQDVDVAAVEKIRDEMAGTQDRIQRLVIEHILEMKEILNPEQEARFFTLLRSEVSILP